jgi:hypothetical protein
MTRCLLLLCSALAFAGCATHAPEVAGPYRALNKGKWQATSDDLQGPGSLKAAGRPSSPTSSEARP